MTNACVWARGCSSSGYWTYWTRRARKGSRVTCPPAGPRIGISISHSGAYALAACCDGPVGVDVQTRVTDSEKLLRLLSEEELAFCQKDPAGFTRLWTLKEAYGKYTGEGLSYPPPHIRFDGERPYMPGLPCRLYEYPPIEEHINACSLEGEKPPLTLLAPEDVL